MKKLHVASKNHIMSKSQILSRSQIMTLIRVLVISGVLILALSWQHALEASNGTEIPTLPLADAIDLAARQNPEITTAKQALELTSSRLRESRGNTKPKISIQGSGHGTLTALPTGASTSSGGSSVTVTVSQSLPGTMPEPFSVGLSPVELSEISLEEVELDFV